MEPVLGKVNAGIPIFVDKDYAGEFSVLENMAKVENVFVLKVKQNSMIDAGIYNGDLVILENTEIDNNHDIVVALIGD